MQKWKAIIKKLLFPPILLIIIFSILSVFALTYSFAYSDALPIIQYLSYGLSAYTLVIVCCRIPNIIKGTKNFINNNPHIVKYKTSLNLRVKISLYINLIINTLFSLFQLLIGIIYNSMWAYSLAIYYILLSIIRFFLLRDTSQNLNESSISQWKKFRLCGILLIIMNIALSVIVFLIVRQNKGFSYHYIYTIGLATFTFTITTLAIINVIRNRKIKLPLVSAIKYISLASSLVSMLSLETAMLNAFGAEQGETFRRIITATTGGVICAIILGLGIYMVAYSCKKIKDYS